MIRVLPCLGEGVLRLSEGQLQLGEPGVFCRRCFPIVLYIVQVGSWGGAPRAKGTLSGFCKIVELSKWDTTI